MLEIPLKTYSSYTEQITLDGEQFVFKFVWNSRDESYYLTILKLNVPLISSIRIVVNWELLHNYTNTELPQGDLFVVDQKTGVDNYTRKDFGSRIKLVYIPLEA